MSNTYGTSIADYTATYQSMALPTPTKGTQKRSLTNAEKQVFTEANNAWANYIAVPANKQQVDNLPYTNLIQAQQFVRGILDSPQFAALRNLLNTVGIDAASFSIALNFEVDLIVGFACSLGAAIGVGNSHGVQSSEFLGLWVSLGIDGGAFAGVQFGLWDLVPTDLAGYAQGIEADFGVGFECSGGIYYTFRGGILGVAVTIGAGVDEGVEWAQSYTFILGDQGSDDHDFGYIKPVYQPRKKNMVIINTLNCNNIKSDGVGNANEIYFIFQVDGEQKYPFPTYDYFSMQEGDTWHCGRSIWFDSEVKIIVYDEDDVNGDDAVASFAFKASDLTLNKTVGLKSSGDFSSGLDDVDYTITVTLVAQNVS